MVLEAVLLALMGADVRDLSLDELLDTPIAVASKAQARTAREAPGIVTAMTREEIHASGARDLLEVLQLIPGFSFHTDVEGVVGAGFRGMWGHEGKVLLIVDGIEMNELLYSTVPLGGRFPVQIIERVEVIRGPGSAVYGGNAELAVINVITKSGRDLMGASIGARYAHSHAGFYDAAGGLSAGWAFENGLDLSANLALGQLRRGHGTYEGYDGRTYDVGQEQKLEPLLVDLSMKFKGASVKFVLDDYKVAARDGYGLASDTTPVMRFRTYAADVRYRLAKWESVVPTVYAQWRLQQPWEVTDTSSDLFYSKTAQRVKGGASVAWTPLDNLELLGGAEVYGDFAALNDPTITGTQTDFQGAQTVSYANVAAYVQGQLDNPYVNVSVGGRYEWNSAVGSNFAPRIALSKRIERLHLKALYSGAFRSPGIENLNLNPAIAAEHTQVAEAEVGLQLSDLFYGSVNAFYMRLENPIVYGIDPATASERYVNDGAFATGGYELDLQLRGKRGFMRGTYSLALPAENNVETYQVRGRPDAILGFAAHKVTLSGLWRIGKGLQLGGSAVYLSSRYGYLRPGGVDADGNPVGALGQHPETLTMNLWVGYENLGLNGLSLSAGVDNLFNAPVAYLQPYDGGHAPLPGGARAFYLRLSYAWKYDR
ncbi:MAG: TonB-dependent receptor plug domain-containing protein [Myxococcaceae bacterium]|nr:TonB-dependent receptor plug domain-containing protein [Myxococcaceae bacterium]